MDTRKPSLKGRKYKKYHDDNNKELSNGNLYDLIKSKHMQRVVRETEYFLVCWNLFQYDLWDGCEVEKHYLVIPKGLLIVLQNLHQKKQKSILKF